MLIICLIQGKGKMYKEKKVGVVVPAHNEEKIITNVIKTMPDFVGETAAATEKEGVRKNVKDITLRSILIDVMIDDIVDQLRDKQLFDTILKIVKKDAGAASAIEQISDENKKEYVEHIQQIWDNLDEDIKQLTRYKDFAVMLKQEYKNLWGAFGWTLHVRELIADNTLKGILEKLINLKGTKEVLSANMHIVINAILNFMESDKVHSDEEKKPARDFYLILQQAGNMSNDKATWRTELQSGDIINSLILSAVQDGVITLSELEEAIESKGNLNDLKYIKVSKALVAYSEIYARETRHDLIQQANDKAKDIESFDATEVMLGNMGTYEAAHKQFGNFTAEYLK